MKRVLSLLLLLSACARPPAPPAPGPAGDLHWYRTAAASGAAVYAVDPDASLVAVTLHGRTRRLALPATVQVDAEKLSASRSTRLKQTDFGMTPFSVGGGLLSVRDELEVRYHIVARRWTPWGGKGGLIHPMKHGKVADRAPAP